MSSLITSRRLLLIAPAVMLFRPALAEAQVVPPPNIDMISNSGNASCSVAQAITALAGNDSAYRDHLENAYKSFMSAASIASEMLDDQDNPLDSKLEISGARIEAIRRFATPGINDGIEAVGTYREYYEFIKRTSSACAEVIKKILENPSDVTDEDIINLFGNTAAINLLNGTLFNFGSAS